MNDRNTSKSWAPPTAPQLPINTAEQTRRLLEFAHHFEITTDEAIAWGRWLDGLTDEWPANYRRPGSPYFAHPANGDRAVA